MGDTFGSFNPTADDPNGGLSGGQLFARKAAAGALSGLGNGLQAQNGGAPAPVDFSKLGGKTPMAPSRQELQPPNYEMPNTNPSADRLTGPSNPNVPYRQDLQPPPQDFPSRRKFPYQENYGDF